MTAKWSGWRYLEARFVTILTIRFKGALVPAWPADRSPTRTGPVEADGAVDAQNAPTAPWKTLLVFHELPQGFPHQITHDKPRKSPESYWETRIDPAKKPFAGPHQVLEYVGRYTHRIAISNNRLLDIEDGHVRFRYKNYRADSSTTHATMTLTATEFIRRVLLHVLPTGFHRICYYGFLGNRHRTEKLARCRQLLGTASTPPAPDETTPPPDFRDRYEALTGVSLRTCPVCHAGHMILVEDLPRLRPVVLDTS